MYVTIDQAKAHLRVDFEDDDNYITDLIDIAEMSVQNEIGCTLASCEVNGILPKPLLQAIKYMVAHMYATREPVIVGATVQKCPYTMEYLFAPYKSWTAG